MSSLVRFGSRAAFLIAALALIRPGTAHAQCVPDTPGWNAVVLAAAPCSELRATPTAYDVPLPLFVRQPLVSYITWRVAHAPVARVDRAVNVRPMNAVLPRQTSPSRGR